MTWSVSFSKNQEVILDVMCKLVSAKIIAQNWEDKSKTLLDYVFFWVSESISWNLKVSKSYCPAVTLIQINTVSKMWRVKRWKNMFKKVKSILFLTFNKCRPHCFLTLSYYRNFFIKIEIGRYFYIILNTIIRCTDYFI